MRISQVSRTRRSLAHERIQRCRTPFSFTATAAPATASYTHCRCKRTHARRGRCQRRRDRCAELIRNMFYVCATPRGRHAVHVRVMHKCAVWRRQNPHVPPLTAARNESLPEDGAGGFVRARLCRRGAALSTLLCSNGQCSHTWLRVHGDKIGKAAARDAFAIQQNLHAIAAAGTASARARARARLQHPLAHSGHAAWRHPFCGIDTEPS